MSVAGEMKWAQSLRTQLQADIQTLRARAREGLGQYEELGMLPENDRLADLCRRLEQVERLVGVLEETTHESDDALPPHLTDSLDNKASSPIHRR